MRKYSKQSSLSDSPIKTVLSGFNIKTNHNFSKWLHQSCNSAACVCFFLFTLLQITLYCYENAIAVQQKQAENMQKGVK
jgi:hypothetical protein